LQTATVNGNRITCLFSFAVGAAAIGLTPLIYRAWLGHLYPGVDAATAILVIAGLAAAVGTTGGTVLFGTGQISLIAKILVTGVVANVVLTIALVKPLGVTGVVLGTVAATVTVALAVTVAVNRRIGISLRESVWTWLWRLVLSAGLAGTSCRLLLILLPSVWQTDRGAAFGILCLLGLLFIVILLLGLRLTRFFHHGDISLLKRVLPGPLARIAVWPPILWLAGVAKE
jgi:O-antigen/teichoic acid export membrane protein